MVKNRTRNKVAEDLAATRPSPAPFFAAMDPSLGFSMVLQRRKLIALNTLLAKIEANARRKLTLAAGRSPAAEMAQFRSFLHEETGRLRMLHRGGASGVLVCRGRSMVVDCLVKALWAAIRALDPPNAVVPRASLVAYGGYGRAELCPFSDVDLMLLYDEGFDLRGRARERLAAWCESLVPALWDAGLKMGSAVRTVSECIVEANKEMRSKTALLEARLVCGDARLMAQLEKEFQSRCVAGQEGEYIRQRLADQAERRSKHGNSAAMQEPNVKNGCGGLRDYQNLLWMVTFRLKIRTLDALQEAGQISAGERRQLTAAQDFLLRTRNELHYTTGRAADTLAAALAPTVALNLGYSDRSPRDRVEALMRDYYTHARNIHLITRTLEQRLALDREPPRRWQLRRRAPAPREKFDGFEAADGQILASSRQIFREDVFRLIRVFLHAQQRGLTLHPDLAQWMRQLSASGLIDRSFMASAHARNTLLEILGARGNVAPTVRAMHEVGFLGKLIPEFGRLTNLVQHEFFHQYAVDEHTLVCLEKLDRVWGATTPPYKNYASIFHTLERPHLLYLALLLHDSGKAVRGEKHELVGGHLAQRVGNRLHLPAETTAAFRLIIEQHLAMVQVSQRRDLDDRETIRGFAVRVGNVENLDMLTLHTFADSMGTSDTLWNGFKDSLLWQLHNRVRAALVGEAEFIRAEQLQRERLRTDVRALLPKTFVDDEIEAHFAGLPDRYINVNTARQIARDLTLAHRFMHLQINTQEISGLEPVFLWREEPDRGHAGLHICTWDRPGLFASLTGAMTAAALNILAAQVYTRQDAIVLDEFLVTDARTGEAPDEAARAKFERLTRLILTGKLDPIKAAEEAPKHPPRFSRAGGEPLPTDIRFDNKVSARFSVIDIETEDRVGLLFAVSSAFTELGLDLSLAKIVTEKGAASDTFYVLDRTPSGPKITDPARQKVIAQRLRSAIAALDKP